MNGKTTSHPVKQGTAEDWSEFICTMPKVELHLHLEGAFTLETLFQLIRKYGGDSSVRTPDDLKERFVYRDFSHFIDTWVWKNQFFRSGVDFELSAHETLMRLSEQNVLYVEAYFSPWDFLGSKITMEEITESVLAGCARASHESGIMWNLIADINREHGPAAGMKRLDQISRYTSQGVIGVGLGGREKEYPAGQYAEVYSEAKRRGLFRTAHAGEAAGAESIWAALNELDVQRIGHGVRADEDSLLIAELRKRQIPLELCITSNVKTGVVPSIRTHPIKGYFDKGLKVTVNTDDPTMFGCNLNGEYLLLLNDLGFSPDEVRSVCMNAVEATSLDAETMAFLAGKVERAWAAAPYGESESGI